MRTPPGGQECPARAPPTCWRKRWSSVTCRPTTRGTPALSGSLGRALALAGETSQARQVGAHAIEVARAVGEPGAISHALVTSLWHGTTPQVADLQLERSREIFRIALEGRDFETLGSAANFRAMNSYLLGHAAELAEAIAAGARSAEMTGQPYYRHVYCCLAHAAAFLRGDFAEAERLAKETPIQDNAFEDDTEGPRSVQLFMVNRERGTLPRFRALFDGHETLAGRWVPGLLALYSELRIEPGMRRCLDHLLDRDLAGHTDQSVWPMELVFMAEAALSLRDLDALERLAPFLAEFAGLNLVAGTLIATFGSADRYLARIAALRGDEAAAERHFTVALAMDRQMRSAVHTAETLAYFARFLAARGQTGRARSLATEAHEIATSVGQARLLPVVEALIGSADRGGPDGLTEREVEVLTTPRRRAEQLRHRRPSAHQRQHGRQPRPVHPAEDRGRQPHPGGHLRSPAPARLSPRGPAGQAR